MASFEEALQQAKSQQSQAAPQGFQAALQAAQAPQQAPATPAAPESQVSPFMSGVAGFNQAVGQIPANAVNLAAEGLDKVGLTDNASQTVQQAQGGMDAQQQAMMAQNPNAGLAGQVVGSIAGSAPAFAAAPATIAGLAAAGGVSSYLGSDVKLPEWEKLQNAGIGAIAAPVLGKATDVAAAGLSKVWGAIKAIPLMFKSPTDLAEKATAKVLESTGGDLSKATPTQFLERVAELKNVAQTQKNTLYDARNILAEKEGINAAIPTDALKSAIAMMPKESRAGFTTAGKVMSAGGVDSSGLAIKPVESKLVPYAQVQKLMSAVSSKINVANRAGDYALANSYDPLLRTLQDGIEKSGGSSQLQQLKLAADAYNRDVYSPLRSANAKTNLVDGFNDEQYLSNIKGSLIKDKQFQGALQPEDMAMMRAAHINALQAAATDVNGVINVNAYAKALDQSIKQNAQQLAPIGGKVMALSRALQAVKQIAGADASQTQHSIGQKIGMAALGAVVGGAGGEAVGGHQGAASGAMVGLGAMYLPKTKFIFGLSRMLKNPETASLLSSASKFTPSVDPNLLQVVNRKIAAKFSALISSEAFTKYFGK